MNLPAAIEDTSGTEIPQSLLEKACYVRDAGGIRALEASMKELPDLLQRNKELLDEVRMFSKTILYVVCTCPMQHKCLKKSSRRHLNDILLLNIFKIFVTCILGIYAVGVWARATVSVGICAHVLLIYLFIVGENAARRT